VVGPAEVGRAQQDAGLLVHDPGQGEPGADQAQPGRQPGDEVGHQRAQPGEGRGGLAAAEVAQLDPLGDDPPSEVEHPGRDEAGVDLQAEGREPGAGEERRGRAAAAGERIALDLVEQPAGDQLVDEPGRGRPGHAGGGRHVGPRQGSGRGAHGAQDQPEVRRPQRRLARTAGSAVH
jgi:hypothetical protein